MESTSTELAVIEPREPHASLSTLTVEQVAQHALLVQQALRSVMREGEHYGIIPGCGDRKTLMKSGAEKLCQLFRIAPDALVEDLSPSPDVIRYRVTVRATHIGTGAYLGSGVGECSSLESKYAWRDVVVAEEYDEAPEDQRREKFQRGRDKAGKPIRCRQVRRNPYDDANTILKMAKKRALVDCILTVTGASDIFGQDVEDLEGAAGGNQPAAAATPAPTVNLDAVFLFGMFAQILGLSWEDFFATVEATYGTRDLSTLRPEQIVELGQRLRAAVEAQAAAAATPESGNGQPNEEEGDIEL